LDVGQDAALDHVAVGLADLSQSGPSGIDRDAGLQSDLEDLALLVLVDVLVVVGPQFDLFDKAFFHFIQRHESLLPRRGFWDGPIPQVGMNSLMRLPRW